MIHITIVSNRIYEADKQALQFDFDEVPLTELAADLNRGSLDLMTWIVKEAVRGNLTKSYALGLAVMAQAQALKEIEKTKKLNTKELKANLDWAATWKDFD